MRRLFLPLIALVMLGACRVDVGVGIEIDGDGSGEVAVTAVLDADAVAELEEVEGSLRTDDLERAGWTIGDPADLPNGGSSITIRRPFATPEEAEAILESVTSAASFTIDQQRTFFRTTTMLEGTIDLTDGLASFGDQRLAESFGGTPLGVAPEALEAHLGEPLAEIFSLEIETRLPGQRSVVEAELGREQRVRVSSNPLNRGSVVLLVVAVASALLAAASLLRTRLAARR